MTTRKDFLVAGTIAATTPGVALAKAPAKYPEAPKLKFDLNRFNALLDGPQSHKHCFASCEINGGEVFGAIRNTLDAYRDVGVRWSDVLPVAVLYHGVSILLAFDDEIWNEYFIPFARKSPVDAPSSKQIASVRENGGRGNPTLRKQGGDRDMSIQSLVADAGTWFFVCNNAAQGVASLVASKLGTSHRTVYRDLTNHLVANAMLVPAGVWAVHAIQEQGFTLLQTSLSTNV